MRQILFHVLPLKIKKDIKSVTREIEYLTKLGKEKIEVTKLENNKIMTVKLLVCKDSEEDEVKQRLLRTKKLRCIFYDSSLSEIERLNRQVTPLFSIPYREQTEIKQNEVRRLLNEMLIPSSVLKEPIKPAVTDNYRNKVEFTIGFNEQEEAVVGFSLGLYREGIVSVCQPTECVHIQKTAKDISQFIQEYIRRSKYRPYDRRTKKGLWRMLVVRIHTEGILCGVQINPEGVGKEELEEAERDISDYLTALFLEDEQKNKVYVRGVFVQYSKKQFNGIGEEPFRLINGVECVYQALLGCFFYISIDSFFQTNKFCVEMLYEEIRKQAVSGIEGKGILLDLCCGTGTIGVILSDDFETVIGVDICRSSIEMARKNASLSKKENISFIVGAVEKVLPDIVSCLQKDIVVVLDPPRAGTTKKVIRLLRSLKNIRRIVYVSCSLKSSQQNIFDLLQDEERRTFEMGECVFVDMFPHTKHFEVVSRLDRKD